ncbi:divergent PAP2 family protein [Oscillospiraceae bacterium MB08-C2-2]|nr:divergent PAP2 family protein [Oscillospiraceae bacterium MB08-C2-2]
MSILRILTSNHIINVGVVSWFSAQFLKTIFTLITTRKVVLERMFGAGGMPSSHSALTCSIAIALARSEGFDSPIFALSLAFAAIVMYDAMGVRRAAGEQAKILNRMIFEFSFFSLPFFKSENQSEGKPPEDPQTVEPTSVQGKELKEFLGHTPVEVLGGCLLGILVSLLLPIKK